MKLLVTGANGLIGSAIRRANPPSTTYLGRNDLDLTDFAATKKVFMEIKPDCIIHAAAVVGGISANKSHPGSLLRDNAMININTMEAARLAGVSKMVSFLSTCAFPDKAAYPLNEKNFHDGPPYDGTFGYAYAKRTLEAQTRAYRKEWGVNYVTVIGTNFYGPGDNFSLTEGHALASLIHKCYLAKINKTDIEVWGSGKPLREFLFADDVARLALWAVEQYNEDTPLIFTSGIEESIKQVVENIVEKMGFENKVIFDTTKPDGQSRRPSDASRLKMLLPNFKFTPLADGIGQTVKWFLEQYPDVRK